MRSRSRAATGLLTSALLSYGLIGPGDPALAASGSTIVTDQGLYTVVYRAGPGQANDPSVTSQVSGDPQTLVYTVQDVAPITPGEGCSWPDPADQTTVACVLHEGRDFTPGIELHLDDLADHTENLRYDLAQGVSGAVSVYGGPGDDVMNTGARATLYGEAGADQLTGHWVEGGSGDDQLVGYIAKGGDGADRIRGTGAGDYVEGGRGDDTIDARGGVDVVYGNSGNDLIRGGTGDDRLYGGPGNDRLYGNSGDDLLVGGPGRDFLSGGPGHDVER